MNKQEAKEYEVGVGESLKVYCGACTTEYEVLHEPNYQGPEMKKLFGGPAKPAKHCPFCGIGDASELEVRG